MLAHLKSMRTKPISWVVLILMLVFGIQCSQRGHGIHKPIVPIIYSGASLIVPEDSPLRSVITVASVQSHSVSAILTLPASIQENPSNTVNVLMPFAGQIAHYYKNFGDVVHKGDPLYAIVAPDMMQAITDKINAQAAYVLAEQTLKRQRELALLNIGPIHDLQLAESVFVQSKAELERSTSRLNVLHVSESDIDASGQLIIRSPIDGTITAVNSGLGAYWSDVTKPIMTVVDISEVYVVASVQERDIPSIYMGQSIDLLVDNDPDVYHGKVSVINPILDPATRTLGVGFVLDNKAQRLKPNMFVRAQLKSKPRDLIVLPLTAVIQRGFDSIVFVEKAPWVFTPRIVKTGSQLGDNIEIQSGLIEKERVALTGGIILND